VVINSCIVAIKQMLGLYFNQVLAINKLSIAMNSYFIDITTMLNTIVVVVAFISSTIFAIVSAFLVLISICTYE
jgi:hypothetical protein